KPGHGRAAPAPRARWTCNLLKAFDSIRTISIKRVDLSPAGHAVLQQVEPGIRRVQERLIAGLTSAEAKTLVRLWRRWPMAKRTTVRTTEAAPRVIDVQAFIDAERLAPLQ